ncbi:hypothetical protein D3C72_1828670 [compost metagenome]
MVDDDGTGQHIVGAACHGDGIGVPQHVRLARRDQHQAAEAHGLDRARHRADVARMAGLDQHEAHAPEGIGAGRG